MVGGPVVYVVNQVDPAALESLPAVSSYEPIEQIEASPVRVVPVFWVPAVAVLVIGAGMVLTIGRGH